MTSPSGTPIMMAARKPDKATWRLASIFTHRTLPSGALFANLYIRVSKIWVGAGSILSFTRPTLTTSCHTASRVMIPAALNRA